MYNIYGKFKQMKQKTPAECEGSDNLLFNYNDLFDDITCPNGVNHFESFVNLSEASMIAVEMGGIPAAVTDEKL